MEREAHLQVQDTGPGIAVTQLAQFFTRFQRGAQPAERSGQGLGLGLYITKQLVTAHGGQIAAESVEGQGTTVTIVLPVLDDEAESVRSLSDPQSSPAE